MALSIGTLVQRESKLPPRTMIYGPPGIGKTTLANEFPNTIFIQTERGDNSTSSITTFDGTIETYKDVKDFIFWLGREPHNFKNVTIDTIDRLAPLIRAHVMSNNGWEEWPTNDWGVAAGKERDAWAELLRWLDLLCANRKMCITLIGHSEIERFDDPRTESYNRFDFMLKPESAQAMVKHWADMILFLNHDPGLKKEALGFAKTNTRTIAQGTSNRWMYLNGKPAYEAKNRWSVPDMPYVISRGYEALSQYLPHVKMEKDAEAANVNASAPT